MEGCYGYKSCSVDWLYIVIVIHRLGRVEAIGTPQPVSAAGTASGVLLLKKRLFTRFLHDSTTMVGSPAEAEKGSCSPLLAATEDVGVNTLLYF
jgi:hypothetical protein